VNPGRNARGVSATIFINRLSFRNAESMSDVPLASIGVPVYNGAQTIRAALDSVLTQDYPHLEIVISDNGSTDETEAICREYARRDPRIFYHRAERNMGAVWNYNRVFQLSNGKYFMWAAADDTRESSFVRACLECLERDSKAVLCYPIVCVMTPGFPSVDVLDGIELTRREPQDRLGAMMRADWWKWGLAIYGLIRSDALRRTRLFENVYGGDYRIVLQLCLQSHFVRCGDTTFYYTRMVTGESDAEYYRRVMRSLSPDNRPGVLWMPYWKMGLRFLRYSASAPMPAATRARLIGVVLRHGLLTRRRALEVRQLIGTVTGLRRVRDSVRKFLLPGLTRS